MSKLEREDPEGLAKALWTHVGMAFKMSGVEDDQMVEMTIDQLMSDPYRKLDAIIKAIDNGMRGKYGKLYGKLTYFQLQEWLVKYDEETSYERESGYNKESRPRIHGENYMKTDAIKISKFTDDQKERIKQIDKNKK